jgi:polysaccharide biosynthesis protein PslG
MTNRRKTLLRLLPLVLIVLSTLSCQESAPEAAIGMTVHPRGADAESIKRQFDLMADMNVTWVRIDIDWSIIESEQSQLDWMSTDTLVDEAGARGMNVLGVLAFSPAWARSSATDPSEIASHSRPDDVASYANFARVAAKRYASQGVHDWEIWNEPNSSKFWPPRPDGDEYGELFRVAAEAIHGVDPAATLLIGGLSPKFEEPEAEISPTDYLEQLYGNGAAQLADGIAVHPYSFPSLPMDEDQRTVGGLKDLPALRTVMDRHGDGGKKIWITEFGAPTGTGPHAVSDEDQAAALLQARHQVDRWDWAGPLIYYELVDGGTDLSDTEQNFGVLREDLSPKPAADALMDGP